MRVPTESLDHGHDVCGAQAAGNWAEGKSVSLFICFIDLRKAYDTVDGTLLWQVLTRIGVPPQMIAVIQQFHDGMRACARPDDGVYRIGSRWSNDYGKHACCPRCCSTSSQPY